MLIMYNYYTITITKHGITAKYTSILLNFISINAFTLMCDNYNICLNL